MRAWYGTEVVSLGMVTALIAAYEARASLQAQYFVFHLAVCYLKYLSRPKAGAFCDLTAT